MSLVIEDGNLIQRNGIQKAMVNKVFVKSK